MRFASCAAVSLIAIAGLIDNAPAGLIKGLPITEVRPIRAAADIEMMVSNKYGYAHLRQQPSEYSKLLATLPEGTKVIAIEKVSSGSWVYVKVGDKEGYIQVNLLR